MTKEEMSRAVEKVASYAKGVDDEAVLGQAKETAGKLWPEVCWSALPSLEAGAPLAQALNTGLYEWDL